MKPNDTAQLTSEAEALRRAYAALNRNDIPGFLAIFDPQAERSEFLDTPQGGTYRGLEAVEAHVHKGRSTWSEGGCTPERFIAAPSGDRIVVLVYVRVRLKNKAEWLEGRVADGYAFRNGKVTLFRTFTTKEQAFEWAGISAAETT